MALSGYSGREADLLTFFGSLGDRVVGAPSILAADFSELAEEVRRAERGGAELVHFDVMDNHFVPNLTVGPAVAASLADAVDLPIDAHLQVTNPDNLIPSFIEAGVVSISVQPEMVEKVRRLKEITDVPVEVDGGITVETAPLMVGAGAQVLVAGSAVFKGDPATEMRRIIQAGQKAR